MRCYSLPELRLVAFWPVPNVEVMQVKQLHKKLRIRTKCLATCNFSIGLPPEIQRKSTSPLVLHFDWFAVDRCWAFQHDWRLFCCVTKPFGLEKKCLFPKVKKFGFYFWLFFWLLSPQTKLYFSGLLAQFHYVVLDLIYLAALLCQLSC